AKADTQPTRPLRTQSCVGYRVIMAPMSPKDSSFQAKADDRRPVAVIDIGSNSVRLVVYSGETRTPIPLHNEKAICALGKGLERTGFLNSQGIPEAFETVARFVKIAHSLGVTRIDALA